MRNQFIIQASDPRTERPVDPRDASLSDALQTVFRADTEEMLMRWNGVRIPLSYKSDFSFMIDDVVDFCALMSSATDGRRSVNWPSSTFDATWDLRWSRGVVEVKATWRTLLGGVTGLAVADASLSIQLPQFLGEWRKPLLVCHRALLASGAEPERIRGLTQLGEIAASLSSFGLLYRK